MTRTGQRVQWFPVAGFLTLTALAISGVLAVGCSEDTGSAAATPDAGAPIDPDQPAPLSQCNDGIDNDGDGLIDWQRDLGCANEWDDDEAAGPRDQELGFTTFDLPKSGLVFYVSAQGSDDNDGTSPEKSLASVGTALKRMKSGQGGWVLLRRGDTFDEPVMITELHGASAEDPVLIASYGDSKQPPVILNNPLKAIKTLDHVAVVGLHFLAHGRDPDHPNYIGSDGEGGVRVVASGDGLLIESCAFTFRGSSIQQGLQNVEVRRSIFYKAYSTNSHAMGLYVSHLAGVTLEENLFDHGGWLIQQIDTGNDQEDGQATFFNHNMYLTSNDDIVVKGNLILRAASMGIKFRADETGGSENITVQDNLFLEGEIGVGIGGNTDEPARFVNSQVLDNVFLYIGRTRPTNRTLAWGLEVHGTDGMRVKGNYFLRQDDPVVTNSYAISASPYVRNLSIEDNFFFRIQNKMVNIRPGETFESFALKDNDFDRDDMDVRMLIHLGELSTSDISGNTYASTGVGLGFQTETAKTDFEGWVAASGETGASQTDFSHPDPLRDLATYHQSIGKEGTQQAFIDAALAQTRWHWDVRYLASAVNAYIRAGYSR